MEIAIEKLVSLVTTEVVRELTKQGVQVVASSKSERAQNSAAGLASREERIDMSKYKTPILTENHIRRLHELTGRVVVPKGTVITPKARELLRKNGIVVVKE